MQAGIPRLLSVSVALLLANPSALPHAIKLRLPLAERTGLEHLGEIGLRTNSGGMVQLSELLILKQTVQEHAIYHKHQKPVVYVVGGSEDQPHRARQALRKSLEESCGICTKHGCLHCTCDEAS